MGAGEGVVGAVVAGVEEKPVADRARHVAGRARALAGGQALVLRQVDGEEQELADQPGQEEEEQRLAGIAKQRGRGDDEDGEAFAVFPGRGRAAQAPGFEQAGDGEAEQAPGGRALSRQLRPDRVVSGAGAAVVAAVVRLADAFAAAAGEEGEEDAPGPVGGGRGEERAVDVVVLGKAKEKGEGGEERDAGRRVVVPGRGGECGREEGEEERAGFGGRHAEGGSWKSHWGATA
jgi:hypothetical protein